MFLEKLPTHFDQSVECSWWVRGCEIVGTLGKHRMARVTTLQVCGYTQGEMKDFERFLSGAVA